MTVRRTYSIFLYDGAGWRERKESSLLPPVCYLSSAIRTVHDFSSNSLSLPSSSRASCNGLHPLQPLFVVANSSYPLSAPNGDFADRLPNVASQWTWAVAIPNPTSEEYLEMPPRSVTHSSHCHHFIDRHRRERSSVFMCSL